MLMALNALKNDSILFERVKICTSYSATAQWYVIRIAVSHHNYQVCIAINNCLLLLLLNALAPSVGQRCHTQTLLPRLTYTNDS